MNSSLLGLEFFMMGLTKKQLIAFKTQRIYSVILLENIPQFALQIWYMVELEEANGIAIASCIFSAISIVVTILSMTVQQHLIKSQEYTVITIEVVGKSVMSKVNK